MYKAASKFLLVLLLLTSIACGDSEVETGSDPKTNSGQSSSQSSNATAVKLGDIITFKFTAKLEDGTEILKDYSDPNKKYQVGSKGLLPGIDTGLIGMVPNQRKTFLLIPPDGFGHHNKSLVRRYPRKNLPEGFIAKKGMTIRLEENDGRIVAARITNINYEEVTLDLNSPYAGQTIYFTATVLTINKN